MKTALLVGRVPVVLKDALIESGWIVGQRALGDPVETDADLVVLHEDDLSDRGESARVEEWLDSLREAQVKRVYHADSFDTRRITRRIVKFAPDLFCEGAEPSRELVDATLNQAEDVPERHRLDGDLILGTYYKSEPRSEGAEVQAYEDRRRLSMVSPSMHELVRDIAFAVDQMARESDGALWPAPPWDPFDLVPSTLENPDAPNPRLAKGHGQPRLSDLYAVPGDDEARRLLGANPEDLDRARRRQTGARIALIRGESGCGKSLAAHMIWEGLADGTPWARDDWTRMPLVKVNCGGMTIQNFDHLMLGAGPSQFTGVRPRVGHFGRADYGVLFLDEIGDMSAEAQSRFKPLLDDLVIAPPGLFAYPLHTRVVAATNVELEAADRGFQHDLLRRFTIQITVPGLTSRTEAEKLMQIDFVAQLPSINPRDAFSRELTVGVIAEDVKELLLTHDWAHGNFRELQEVVQAAVASARKRGSTTVEKRDLSFSPKSSPGDERVVRVRELGIGVGLPATEVLTRGDLVQASRLLNSPIYRLPDGSEIVVADAHRLVHRPEADDPAATLL